MTEFAMIVLAVCAVSTVIVLNQAKKGILKHMANINETLQAINTRLDEATTELLALIGQLQGEQLTPEGRAALEQIKTKVDALADVVPNAP